MGRLIAVIENRQAGEDPERVGLGDLEEQGVLASAPEQGEHREVGTILRSEGDGSQHRVLTTLSRRVHLNFDVPGEQSTGRWVQREQLGQVL